MDERLKRLTEKAELVLNKDENQDSDIPRGDFNRIIQELKVYQIELEIQNEELREAQRSLEESRNSYAQLYNQAPAGYVTLSSNGMILQANQTFLEMVSQDMQDVLNSSFTDFIANDQQKIFLSRYNAFFKKPDGKKMELKMMKKKGSPFYVRITGSLISDNAPFKKGESQEQKLFIIISDITQEKKIEASLLESEFNYRTLANTGQALIWASGTDKLCNYFNDVWLEFTGRTLEMEMGNGWVEGVHPDDVDRCFETYVNAFDKREKFSMEYRLRRHDGAYRWLQDDGSPRYNSQGDFIGYLGFCLDVHESKQNKIQLAKSNERYKEISYELAAILDHIPGLVFYKNSSNTFIRVNKSFADAYQKDKSEFEGLHLSELFSPEMAQLYHDDDLRVINSGIPLLNFEEQWNAPNGKRWLNTSKLPFFNEQGDVIGIIGISMDITERKQNEEQLALQNAELQKLNAEKDKFFSIIAHDLKSPFIGISGFSKVLVEQVREKDYDGIEKYAEIIQQSSKRAMDLLINLMEWASSQTGLMEFTPVTLEMGALINEIALMFDDIAGQKSIVIKRFLTPNAIVVTDKAMISTVLRNLISNAIKFTNPGGEIILSLEKNLSGELTVSVSDDGVGIPKSRIDKLFRIDENFSTPGTQKEKGTGLGLILCKEFVEKHKGQIWVESEEGKGSTFSFVLPTRTSKSML
jgi:hypothetical protein